MAIGLGLLRLAPRDLWTSTPREIAAAVRGLGGRWAIAIAPAPDRASLDSLMRRFPD